PRQISPARPSVSPVNMTDGSRSRPIETRKTGTKTAEPKNSTRSMEGPSFGTSRLRASPAKKAPTIPSIPKTSASIAMKSSATMITRYRATPSEPHRRAPVVPQHVQVELEACHEHQVQKSEVS